MRRRRYDPRRRRDLSVAAGARSLAAAAAQEYLCGGSRSTFGAQRRSAFGSLYRPTRRSRAGHTAAACVRTGCADEGKTALWSRARCCTSTRPRRRTAARDARAPCWKCRTGCVSSSTTTSSQSEKIAGWAIGRSQAIVHRSVKSKALTDASQTVLASTAHLRRRHTADKVQSTCRHRGPR